MNKLSKVLLGLMTIPMVACSMPNLNPFSSPDSAPKPPSHATEMGSVGVAAQGWTDLVYQWWWMSLVLVLLFPQIRQPVLGFWTAIFRVLTTPLELARLKFEAYKSKKFGAHKSKK